MPCTPWRRTSSAIRNASIIEVDWSSTSSSLSFGMTMVVSQAPRSTSVPSSACRLRRVPSNLNGSVTIPTVSAPRSREMRGDDGSGARSGSASLARGHEHHVRAPERVLDLVVRVLGGLAADLGVGAGSEAAREVAADVELGRRVRVAELLHVGVDRDELDLGNSRIDHPVDGVQPGAADTDDLDVRHVARGLGQLDAVQARRGLRQRDRLEPALPLGLRCRRGLDLVGRSLDHLERRRVLDRLLLDGLDGPSLAVGLLLRRFGGAEELGQWALTHAGALASH